MSTLKSINFNANFNPKEVKKCISTKAVKVVQNENSVVHNYNSIFIMWLTMKDMIYIFFVFYYENY